MRRTSPILLTGTLLSATAARACGPVMVSTRGNPLFSWSNIARTGSAPLMSGRYFSKVMPASG